MVLRMTSRALGKDTSAAGWRCCRRPGSNTLRASKENVIAIRFTARVENEHCLILEGRNVPYCQRFSGALAVGVAGGWFLGLKP
jgi:hypothetical protein